MKKFFISMAITLIGFVLLILFLVYVQ